MRLVLVLVTFILVQFCAICQNKTRILLVGNSILCANNLPTELQTMLQEHGYATEIYAFNTDGYTLVSKLKQALTNKSPDTIYPNSQYFKQISLQTLQSSVWNIIILQETVNKLLIPEMKNRLFASIQQLQHLVQPNGTRTYLISPYLHHKYPNRYCTTIITDSTNFIQKEFCSESMFSSYQEQTLLDGEFARLKQQALVEKIPLEDIYHKARNLDSPLVLLSDATHPNKMGSYLIAGQIFKALTGKTPTIQNTYFGNNFTNIKLLNHLLE
jgi:hypothetical protein